MNLSVDLFNEYFENKISMDEFVESLGIAKDGFLDYLRGEISKTYESQDSDRLECLIYTLMLWDDRISKDDTHELVKFLNILNNLLISDWHCQHENIVLLIQKISDIVSLEYLYKAIELQLQYLEWDDNYSFKTKCVRAIYKIGGKEAASYLERLCRSNNDIVKEVAQSQISKL